MAQDIAQAKRFLTQIDGEAEEFFFLAVDKIHKGGNRPLIGSFEDLHPDLVRLNQAGRSIFVLINEANGTRKAEDIVRVRSVCADLDDAPLDPVLSCGLDPHIIVETSPAHYHAYWLTEGLDVDLFKPVQQSIASIFGGTTSPTPPG
jgi:hypothetical protein